MRRRAAAVEAEAEAYPEERAECLLEAAQAWRLAGDPERAIAVLAEWPTWTDRLEAGRARVETAESLYALGRDDDAEQRLAALRADRPDLQVCNAAAELLVERGEWRGALGWYDLAVSTLSVAELTAATALEACFGGAALVLHGRAQVRAELGLGADMLDRSVPDPAELGRLLAEAGQRFPTSSELLSDPAAESLAGARVRSLFWPAGELVAAAQAWPEVFEATEGYHRELELQFRQVSERAGRSLELVPARVEPLAGYLARTGRDVADAATRHGFMTEQAAAGAATSWPPDRNDACWCGSGSKYKKCCARASQG